MPTGTASCRALLAGVRSIGASSAPFPKAGHNFTMLSLAEIGQMVDRNSWYLAEARRELNDLSGPSHAEFERP